MKTQQEIEEMKDNIEIRISETTLQMVNICENALYTPSLSDLSDKKRQLMAQYNILLEVLK